MFSSVFEKIVSPSAPDALDTFPPRADLPASPSTLCCLSFADHFITHYPTAQKAVTDDDADGRLLRGRAGIAMSANDLEVIMQSAAELGGRLAAALSGTVRSKRRELATAPVSELLGKVRGIFGNRLTCVGREIRVSRNTEAEGDETLLLRQIHAIKSAALSACEAQKWCFIVSSGGESLTVCSIPLPAVEDGGACGCDFLVFDPWPRLAMKLRGSYVVKFTTVRGLQLHLLSALGEIWREEGLPQKEGMRKEFVGISVVMKTARGAEGQATLNGRRQLEDSVTSLRKAEKAAAIKIKREEIESLRQALDNSEQDKQRAIGSPISGGMCRLTRDATEVRQMAKDGDLSTESVLPLRTSTQRYRQQQLPVDFQRFNLDTEKSISGSDNIQATMSDSGALAASTVDGKEQIPVAPAATYDGLGDAKSPRKHGAVSNSCDRPGVSAILRPPVADVSPPLSMRRSERERQPRRYSDENDDFAAYGSGRIQAPGMMAGGEAGTNAAMSTPEWRGSIPLAAARDLHTGDVEGGGLCTGDANDTDGVCPPSGRPETAIWNDPLHRALLRSIEGEELAEYSKRAYRLYRTNGVIEGGAGLDEHQEMTSDALASSACQLFERLPLSRSAIQVDKMLAPATSPQGRSEPKIGRDDDAHIQRVQKQEYGPLGVGICEPVRPFSPSPVSPQALPPYPETYSHKNAGQISTAAPPSTSDNELRVVDLSEAVDPITPKSVVLESQFDGCRSRLRAPRAGRALALASANAHGIAKRRQAEWSRVIRQDVPESRLPSERTGGGPARRKEAWTKEKTLKQQDSDRALKIGQLHTELSGAKTSGGILEISSEEDEDDMLDRSAASLRRAVPPREDTDRKLRPSRQQKEGKKPRKRGENILVGIRAARVSCEEDRHPDEGEALIGPSRSEPNPIDEGLAITESASRHSLQYFTIPATTDAQHANSALAQSHVPCLQHVPSGVRSALPKPVHTSPSDTNAARIDDGETSEIKSLESCGERVEVAKEKSRDSHSFVWFGQPDTPPRRQSGESVGANEGATDSDEAPMTDGAGQRVGRVISSLGHQRSKARLILQMEVRRQRDIIDKATQAREEEGRIRRARIGAEVFKRMQDVRSRRTLSSQKSKAACTELDLKEQQSLARLGEGHDKELHAPLSRKTNTCARSPPQGPKAAKVRPPSGVDGGAEPTAQAIESEQLFLDLKEVDEAVAPRQDPPTAGQRAPCVAAVADNPWLRVVTMQKVEHENGIPRKRDPTPPPVSFNVEANTSESGARASEGAQRLEREKTRRQERYEALRTRKMAEEAERRRGQKERQIAAREEHRRQSAAAAVAATAAVAAAYAVGITAEKQQGSQDVRNDGQPRYLPQHGSTGVESSSRRNSGYAAQFAPSSSIPRNGDNNSRHGVNTHGDSNGSGAGGGIRPPAVLAGRLASPVIRGFSRRSNRKLVRNAINFLCLAGGHLEDKKARALEALDSHLASNFVVLLAHTKLLSFKGIYACSGEDDGSAVRVFGLGPPEVDASMASGFYKYNSAAREFREVHSKTLGKTTDAISMEPTRIKRPKALATQ
ncbi:unnamed protein product [Scytosiphon promiscuus]